MRPAPSSAKSASKAEEMYPLPLRAVEGRQLRTMHFSSASCTVVIMRTGIASLHIEHSTPSSSRETTAWRGSLCTSTSVSSLL
mmetsp:Transcript_21431/g.55701  ORF Transcript_21431/g.55701 Transcript_21431/m.55701 type:complete len:83 (+) Transcript_21431:704-952(+)